MPTETMTPSIKDEFEVWLLGESLRIGALSERERLILQLAFVGGRISGVNAMARSLNPKSADK